MWNGDLHSIFIITSIFIKNLALYLHDMIQSYHCDSFLSIIVFLKGGK